MSAEQEQTYWTVREGLRIGQVQAAAKEAWKQMREPGTRAHASALACGVDPEKLPDRLDHAIVLRPDGAGISTTDLVVMLATGAGAIGTKMVWDLWKYVLLAHIRHRWGDHALKAKRDAARRLGTRSESVARRSVVSKKQTTKKKAVRKI